MITGLESDYYCAHNPIPVEVTNPSEYLLMQIKIGGVNMIENPPAFYPLAGTFKIDISAWVRQFMAAFGETETYTDIPTVYANDYVRSMEIVFIDSSAGTESVTRKFVHCALDQYRLSSLEDDCCVKIWEGYPFSSPIGGWDDRIVLIPDEEPEIDICGCVEYDDSGCPGVYLKWLNARGYYSYWLFPNWYERNREGDEIFRTPRNVFNPDRTSNEDTVGFDVTETIRIVDRVSKRYENQLKSLVGSPEVYLLRPTWKPGTDDTAEPNDWIKIIQEKPKFNTNAKNNSMEFEMEFNLPKVYTQKLI